MDAPDLNEEIAALALAVESAALDAVIDDIVRSAVADMPLPRDGRDADPTLIRDVVERHLLALPTPAAGEAGADGAIGPMPAHEWRGTQLRFEVAPGEWGAFVDLRGPVGRTGNSGGGIKGEKGDTGPQGLPGASVGNSYMPGGW